MIPCAFRNAHSDQDFHIKYMKAAASSQYFHIRGCSLLLAVLWVIAGFACPAFAASAVRFYLSPNGNDAWSGLKEQSDVAGSDGPLATLDGVRRKVREHRAKGVVGPVTVEIRGGEYTLDRTVVFGVEDSGNEKSPVTYRAYPGEKPVFTGGIRLSQWKKLEAYPEHASKEARGNLWVHDIPEERKGKWRITSLYAGQDMLTRAYSPNLKIAPEHKSDELNAQPKDIFRSTKADDEPIVFRRDFAFNQGDLRAHETPEDIEVLVEPKHKWLINILPLASVDVASRTAHFAVPPTYGVKANQTYWIENAIEHLKEPGEWVFQSKEGRVYYWPKSSDPSGEDIRAPYLQEFIRVEGVEDKQPVRFLHFEGLTFRHGLRDTWRPDDKGLQHDWEMYDKGSAVLRFRHAEDSSVRGCTFQASSGTGLRLDLHCQRITVADNIFENLGGTGILLSGYAPGTKDVNKHNTITNNYIHHVGELYFHSPGIFIAQSGHNTITHNTIHDLPYNGMIISGCRPHELLRAKPLANRREWNRSLRMHEIKPFIAPFKDLNRPNGDVINAIEPLLHARENLIESNEIARVMLRLHDGNGIYLSAMGKNNLIRKNYLFDIYCTNGTIRPDDDSAPCTIEENVSVHCGALYQIKGETVVRNNFALNVGFYCMRRFLHKEMDHEVYFNNDDGMNYQDPNRQGPYVFELFRRISNSIVYCAKGLPEAGRGADLIDPARRGAAEVGLLYTDPRFDMEAMKRRVFRFLPDSPAHKLGIKPIDLSKAGSTLAPKTDGWMYEDGLSGRNSISNHP